MNSQRHLAKRSEVWKNMLGVQGRREFNAMEQQSFGVVLGSVGANPRCCECMLFWENDNDQTAGWSAQMVV